MMIKNSHKAFSKTFSDGYTKILNGSVTHIARKKHIFPLTHSGIYAVFVLCLQFLRYPSLRYLPPPHYSGGECNFICGAIQNWKYFLLMYSLHEKH